MRSLVLRTLGVLIAAGIGATATAGPAAATGNNTFRLVSGGVVASGSYDHMMSIPEQPAPPIRVTGTLTGRDYFRCAVIQVGRSGPADGLEWQTFGRHCGPGRTKVRVQANYMFRGVQPPVRLCSGWSLRQAEQGRQCDLYRPPTDR
ncbi:hypothetical protein M1L60_00610 [Actinoplanes sp. TRM 88003]|uniref:Secreted protein n=1 Tax=Paractinoplanes aksuensis TaxID=2939490 RepID=A0ABT1DE57_9ACTN|nr:hypothetical protein [Actinoplanes aksuensis]MCO8269084.1 hypothetical protein [Actinoplanes aksuensis]